MPAKREVVMPAGDKEKRLVVLETREVNGEITYTVKLSGFSEDELKRIKRFGMVLTDPRK